MPKTSKTPKTQKANIPRALREQVWLKQNGKVWEVKCPVSWCENNINVWDFHVGHNRPESKGGKTEIDNLRPICSRCNLSMGNKYTIDEWSNLGKEKAAELSPPRTTTIDYTNTRGWCCC